MMKRIVLLVLALTLTALTGLAQESGSEVTLVEYSDYQCPACAQYHPVVEQLKNDFGDRLTVEYRYFPLNSHPHAAIAARAAESAKKQGKFLELHNLLFENQRSWSSSSNPQSIFIGYAEQLGMDVDQFRQDLNASETQRAVMEEKQGGQQQGVNSTPSFMINGEMIEQNPRSYEEFKELIGSYLDDQS